MFTVSTIPKLETWPKARGAAMAFCDEEGVGGLRTCYRSNGRIENWSNFKKKKSEWSEWSKSIFFG